MAHGTRRGWILPLLLAALLLPGCPSVAPPPAPEPATPPGEPPRPEPAADAVVPPPVPPPPPAEETPPPQAPEEPATAPVEIECVVHEPSGMRFPKVLGPFVAEEELHRYDDRGRDASMGYLLKDGKGWVIATVYVYPARRPAVPSGQEELVRRALAEQERDSCVQAILQRNPEARRLLDEAVVLENQDPPRSGWNLTFAYDQKSAKKVVPVHSHLLLFCHQEGDWHVKFRFTHPATFDADGLIETFLHNFRWTLHPE